MAGLAEEDGVFTPISRSVKKRLPWTILNLVTASLAASVVGFFEGTLQEILALVTFMPVVAGVARQRRDPNGHGHYPRHRPRRVGIRLGLEGDCQTGFSECLYRACGRRIDRIGGYFVERQSISRRGARQRHDLQSRINGRSGRRGNPPLVKSP